MTKVIFEEAQVAGIPLSVPDVLVGLQTGLVDVVYAPPGGAIAMQWFTKTKYCTDVPLIYLVGGLVLKKSVFSRLPPDCQNAMRDSFNQHMSQLKHVIRKENQEALQVMAKHGVKILKPTADQIDEFKALSNKAMNRLGKNSFSKETRAELEGHLKAFREEQSQ
jgi:TRAP-type C4-dicarboxylate transport system substrate-binding protein